MDKRGFTPLERKFCLLGKRRKTFSLLQGGVKKYIARVWLKSHMSFLTGFTLIELLIAVAIIGILAGAAVTAYIGTAKKAARSEAYSNLKTLYLLEEEFFALNPGTYTGDLGIAGSTVVIRDANLAAIRAVLPGFRPGNAAEFSYRTIQNVALDTANITVPYDGASVVQTPCFIAIAEGLDDLRVDGDVFAIDCNNDTTF